MVRGKIRELINKTIKQLQEENTLPFFQIPRFTIQIAKERYGDFSTDICFKIGKSVKRNPMIIARLIRDSLLRKDQEIFERIEIKKPGYINFFLKNDVLLETFQSVVKRKGENSRTKKRKKLLIDYSSPNIAKPFGIGHLRSTIIGQAIYNIYRFLGWQCIGDNHIGDWGTQFGKLIYQIKKDKLRKKTEKERREILESLTIKDLEKLYVEFHREAEKKPEMEEEARSWFKKLERGDKEAKEIWRACRDISLKEFSKIYKILGVKMDYTLGESFYYKMLKRVIEEAVQKKVAVESQGALIIDYPEKNLPPAILQKSDGATTYLTRDLAAIKYRLKRWNPNIFVYEVGTEQTLYFRQLFSAVELLGWAKKERFIHVAHGLVRLKHGKLSTRKGKTVHLEDILKEAVARAEKIIESSGTSKNLSERKKKEIAREIGIGAIKYNDLAQEPRKDIVFNWARMLNLKGDSGPYLQYTACRCKTLLRKSGKKRFYLDNKKDIQLLELERRIMKRIVEFPEVVREAAETFSPNLIARFALNLAKDYNRFYDNYPILKATSKKKNLRLFLSFSTYKFLDISLGILGIKVPEKM